MESFSKLTYLKYLRGVKLKSSTFHVLVCVFNYSDQFGRNAHPGIRRLAEDSRLSESTVKRSLDELRNLGWLREESRGRSIQGKASLYSLTAPPAAVKAYTLAKRAKQVGVTEEEGTDQDLKGRGQVDAGTGHTWATTSVAHDLPTDPLSNTAAADPSASGDLSDVTAWPSGQADDLPSWGSDLPSDEIPLPPEPEDDLLQ